MRQFSEQDTRFWIEAVNEGRLPLPQMPVAYVDAVQAVLESMKAKAEASNQ